MSLWQLALTFFILANPIGNVPVFLSLVQSFPARRQRQILLREGVISLGIALFFQYFGELFLNLLHVQEYALTLSGGVILLIIALEMIFPLHRANTETESNEPFVVPIAIPLISGAGVLSMIVLFTKEEVNNPKVTGAIFVAWTGILLVLLMAPLLQHILGKKGLLAMQQLMGMLLTVIGVSVLVKGFYLFAETL